MNPTNGLKQCCKSKFQFFQVAKPLFLSYYPSYYLPY